MKPLSPSLFALLFLMVAGMPVGSLADEIDAFVRSEMEAQRIPGAAILVVKAGSVAKMKGYGLANVEHEVAATADTIFQSGSLGKQFTAAGVLMLRDEGKLQLDDAVAKYFPGSPESWKRITIKQLLSHTTGIGDYAGEGVVDWQKDYTEDELLEILWELPFQFEAGTKMKYSNSGYLALGILISKVTGTHWSEYIEERIFKPLGMDTARVISVADIVPHRAAGYRRNDDGELLNQHWVSPTFLRTGDGALYFSVKDLAAWDAGLREGRLLSAKSYEEWWTPTRLTDGELKPYGLGWQIGKPGGRLVVSHGGAWQGFKAYIYRYVDDRVTVAVLANMAGSNPRKIAQGIAGLVDERLRPKEPSASN